MFQANGLELAGKHALRVRLRPRVRQAQKRVLDINIVLYLSGYGRAQMPFLYVCLDSSPVRNVLDSNPVYLKNRVGSVE